MGKRMSATSRAEQEATWKDRLARHAASGQSVDAFCRSEGVSGWSFYQWRKRLASELPAAQVEPARFIDLGAVDAGAVAATADMASAGSVSDISIRIELGGGIVVHISRS